jgi:Bacterial PH domain
MRAQGHVMTKTLTTRHLFRQRSPLVLAAACGVIGLVLLVSIAREWVDDPQPLFAAWVLFGLALAWSLFVRPAVLLDDDGVTIRNVVRDVHIPWARVTDVEFRWNLKVFAGDRAYTAWAISSQVERPKHAFGGTSALLPRRLDTYASAYAPSPTPTLKVTARMVARSIEQAKEGYAEAVARGALADAPDGQVRVTWVPLVLTILVVAVLAVAALSLA